MTKRVVLKGVHWHGQDPEIYRLSPDVPDSCETVCDDVEINEPFVTLESTGRNRVFVQCSDVVLIEEFIIERPAGTSSSASA